MPPTTSPPNTFDVSVITDSSDLKGAFEVEYACFGEQVPDAILQALNPGWETPAGQTLAVERMVTRFNSATSRNDAGTPNTVYLKATVTQADGTERIVGFAIWVQLSAVTGQGDPPPTDWVKAMDLDSRYPDDKTEQAYIVTLFEGLTRQRHALIEAQASSSQPAVMALDLCVVHPEFQRRGIASRLVQWGLDEAKRRGGLIACMEASTMGRLVYVRQGFEQEGPEMEYGDLEGAKFARIGLPSNVFMRTQGGK